MNSVIVLIGYNRKDCIRSCFEAVRKAEYPGDDQVDLYFSLDYSPVQQELTEMIDAFSWTHGEKRVIAHPERQGLRKHVISCGNLIGDHDFLIMLEDDVVVSDSYYLYVREAMRMYGDDPSVAGVSLYQHYTHPQVGRRFEPEYNGSDVYLLQSAQSWGQSWSNRMWKEFHDWYISHPSFEQPEGMADYSYGWDERSWLRYYMGYICSNHLFMIYPYHSFSTNMEEVGENRKKTDTDYQVSTVHGQRKFRMYPMDQLIRYDAFFERMGDPWFIPVYQGEEVLMDLNGSHSRTFGYRYMLSTRYLPYEVVRTYGLKLRPQEVNFRENVEGNDLYLYDLSKPQKKQKKGINPNVVRYDVRAVSWARLSYLGLLEFGEYAAKKLRKKK
ncbi:MAG: hypothetical protein IKE36_11910 [Solobacterium sp.]|nr:hypothetical protein [Solobacterium sp.]